MKTIFLLLSVFCLGGVSLNAQVGIGNPTPDSTSVLDLTNPNNKGVVLPKAANQAAMSNSVNGMTYFYNNNIFYKTDSGYNGFSPWKFKFNGNITNDMYYNLGGNIGIGNANLTQSPEAPLQIETVDSVNLIDNGSLMIGSSTGVNTVINNHEIQSRNAGSSSSLKINEDGGDVTFGSDATKVNVKASDRMQELHSPTNTYYDLLPSGTIVMWYGDTSTIPTGWALCDGSAYVKSDGSGNITTPNLSGRFVVGVGNNGTTNYNAGQTGGQDSVTMTEAEMPAHVHYINISTLSSGTHNHGTVTGNSGSETNGSGLIDRYKNYGDDDSYSLKGPSNNNYSSITHITTNGGSHTHTVRGDSDSKGGNSAHENRPTYTALVYMMKL